jgi:hypothetical protein
MSYCALDEAFLGPAEDILPVKRHKKLRPKETSVPTALPDVPGSVKADDILGSQPMSQDQPHGPNQTLQAGHKTEDFFPVPGESWDSAFMLNSDFTKTIQRPDSSVPVAGRPTLWRESVASAPASQSVQSSAWNDVNNRLDKLTKQLEKLTMPTQNQSTAELFLFVAIGLIILLAIDTLLRFAASIRGPYESPIGIHTGGWRPRMGKVRFR